MKEQKYAKLKCFYRVSSVREIFNKMQTQNFFEESTISKIQENILAHKKREIERLKKIESLAKILQKVENQTVQYKFYNNESTQ